jgi:hypothetical protein
VKHHELLPVGRTSSQVGRLQGEDGGGKISLDSLMQLFQLSYMKHRGRPDYMSHFSEYMADLVGELDKLPDAGKFWKLSPLEKAAFSLASKLGFM